MATPVLGFWGTAAAAHCSILLPVFEAIQDTVGCTPRVIPFVPGKKLPPSGGANSRFISSQFPIFSQDYKIKKLYNKKINVKYIFYDDESLRFVSSVLISFRIRDIRYYNSYEYGL